MASQIWNWKWKCSPEEKKWETSESNFFTLACFWFVDRWWFSPKNVQCARAAFSCAENTDRIQNWREIRTLTFPMFDSESSLTFYEKFLDFSFVDSIALMVKIYLHTSKRAQLIQTNRKLMRRDKRVNSLAGIFVGVNNSFTTISCSYLVDFCILKNWRN